MATRYREIKEACCEANRRLPALGLVDLTFGNVSVANAERSAFAIKPSGVPYAELTPNHMVVLDLSGKIIEGDLRPSSDAPTHARLIKKFPGVLSVVHTHSRFATSWAQAGMPIPCLGTTHADYFSGDVPVTRALSAAEIAEGYEAQTGDVIAECLAGRDPLECPAALVRGHAPFAWGESAEKALETALALEIVAQMAYQTRLINPRAEALDEALLEKHFSRKHGPSAYYGQKK
jgi:L-ribulose-5-phosphate 4-epimerase